MFSNSEFENESGLNCQDTDFDLTQENWWKSETDTNLRVALDGGIDTDGLYWQGQRKNESMAEAIGRQFWNFHGALERKIIPLKIPWVFLASSALKNIN